MRRARLLCFCVAGLVALATSGCGSAYDTPIGTEPESAESAVSAPASEPQGEEPQPAQAEAEPDVAAKSTQPDTSARAEKRQQATPGSTPRSPSSQPERASIQLSAGVALAQTLPTGTAMGFSVDYQFLSGWSDTSAKYFWVIEPTKAKPVRQPAQLKIKGTLQGFATQLRPEHGPFQTHIDTGPEGAAEKGLRLSRRLGVRVDGLFDGIERSCIFVLDSPDLVRISKDPATCTPDHDQLAIPEAEKRCSHGGECSPAQRR